MSDWDNHPSNSDWYSNNSYSNDNNKTSNDDPFGTNARIAYLRAELNKRKEEENVPLEIPVTDQDLRIQKNLDRINLRQMIYNILLWISIILFLVCPLLAALKIRLILTIVLIVSCCMMILSFILSIIAGFKIKKNFKRGLVEPILIQLLNYHPKASKFFKTKAPLKKFIRQINIEITPNWKNLSVSDCILGEINNTKFAFVDFQLSHQTGRKNLDTVIDFKGQMVFMPLKDVVPENIINKVYRMNSSILNKIHDVFQNAFLLPRGRSDGFEANANSSDPFGQYSNYSSNYSTNYSMDNDKNQAHSNKPIPAEQARIMLDKWGPCFYYYTEKDLVFIFKNEKDPFEAKTTDNSNDFKIVKKRILDEANWVKFIIHTIIRTGIV